MTQAEWQHLQEALDQLTVEEKQRVIDHVKRSLEHDSVAPADQAKQQRSALDRLRNETDKLPIHNPEDGLSNRDHDDLLYGEAS